MTYDQVLEYLYKRLPMFQNVGAVALKKDLTNTIRLLDAIDNPHQKLRFIHVAGTNGKGTSAHTIASILQESGYKTGLYTSPHLKSFTERIKINGLEIEKDFVISFVSKNQAHIESLKPSFFEVTVAMCLAYFNHEKVDIAIMETGLGGRLDSTNVIIPEVSLITMIGNDHADLLGNTMEKIAKEKAGIIKKGIPVVIGEYQSEIFPVFQERANEMQAELFDTRSIEVSLNSENLLSKNYSVRENRKLLYLELVTDVTPDYFMKNIPGILKTLEVLNKKGYQIHREAILKGFRNIKNQTGLKGRFQILGQNPLVVADISHNEPGLMVLMDQVGKRSAGDLYIVFGVVKDKDLPGVLKVLPKDSKFFWTQSSVPRSLPAPELRLKARELGYEGEVFEEVNLAIQAATQLANKEDIILICGSTFVVAEIEDL